MSRPKRQQPLGIERFETRAMLAVRALPTVSIADASVAEGNSGSKTLSFVVSLSSAAEQTTTVSYGTVNGTATVAGGDYVAKTGTISFRAGQRTAMVSVGIRGDRTVVSASTAASLSTASCMSTV
jgi:hypothetical protein